jgi:hypothetical protein
VWKNVVQVLAISRGTGSNWVKAGAGLTRPAKITTRPLLIFIEGSFAGASGLRLIWSPSVSVTGAISKLEVFAKPIDGGPVAKPFDGGPVVYLIIRYDEVKR